MQEWRDDLRAPSRVISLVLATAVSCAAQVPVYTVTAVAGYGGPPSTASVDGAAGLAVDSSGNLYISDGRAMVFKLTPTGTVSVVAGGGPASPFLGDGGPATSAELLEPMGLVVDSSGNLYIAALLSKLAS
ncbi:MAG TPA: hypothetical protein VIY49_14530 [Bryobacteraceae bacterium]